MTRARAIVVQFGGRRQYAVPSALARSDRLEYCYTDLCAGRGVGRLATLVAAIPALACRIDLSNRRPPPEVVKRTHIFPSWYFDMRRALAMPRNASTRIDALRVAHEAASTRMIRAGFGDATHVLAMFGEGLGFQRAARDAGLTVATDIAIAPSAERIVRDEVRAHPGWETEQLYYGETLDVTPRRPSPVLEIIDAAHIFLCPSDFVARDLIETWGVAPDRVRLLPYVVNPKWFDLTPAPEEGRILFAGGAGLRKGIHTLAEAARLLRARGRTYDVIVAGNVSASVRNRPETAALTFLGRLDGPAMMREFARADLFAFPSIAEGSAGVTYEALGAGVPVVTTFEAGSVVREGIEGRIVPSRDPAALADAIDGVIQDRAVRTAMSAAARVRAQDHSWAAYEARLIAILFPDVEPVS